MELNRFRNLVAQENRYEEDTPFRDDQKSLGSTETYVKRMRIKNVDRVKDSGVYKCEVGVANSKNNDKMTITILDENESVIEIAEPTNRYLVEISSRNRDVKFSAKVTGHPKPESKWYDNRGIEIPYSPISDKKSKHEIQIMDYSTILIIRNPDLGDFGNYTVKASNGIIEKEKQFRLIVKGKRAITYTSGLLGLILISLHFTLFSTAVGYCQRRLHHGRGTGEFDVRMCWISDVNNQMDVHTLSWR